MMRAVLVLVLLGCGGERPPPRVCEPPPPEPKKVAVGACPISYSDAGSDADSGRDSGYDAPR
jgi:hypothetical protein